MSQKISAKAANAREQSRKNDGKFGNQPHDKAEGIDLYDTSWMDQDLDGALDEDGVASAEPEQPLRSDPLGRFDWDPRTAEPTDFDARMYELYEKSGQSKTDVDNAMRSVHYSAGDRQHYVGRQRQWGMSDDEAIQRSQAIAASGKPGLSHDAQRALERLDERVAEHNRIVEDMDDLNTVYRDRGAWERAYLVTNMNGHVHRDMGCSTTRPTTRFSWQTQFSGKTEDEIVDAAGYRACTVCYPSAPVGDEHTLPTQMFTEEEVQREKDRKERERRKALTPAERRAEDRERKKAEKLARAATKDGKPLKFEAEKDGVKYRKVVSTEFEAESFWRNSYTDAVIAAKEPLEGMEELKRQDRVLAELGASFRPQVARALAEKHGRTPLEQKRLLDEKFQTENESWMGKVTFDDDSLYED